MQDFTPLPGLIGGLMIGLAATLLLLLNGRIAGISGVLGGIFAGNASERTWRAAFILGLVVGPFAVTQLTAGSAAIEVSTSVPILILAGLLVGFGTRLGSGCTSGHGVCGLARGSRRSVIATVMFFALAAATVFIMRHLTGGA